MLLALDDRPGRSASVIALVALGGCVVSGVVHGIPVPTNHDQFSYLLAAETFASGRLANPTHPHWEFFETFHVIHEPTYVSKYPPGQGLLLAFGLWIAGLPILGVWLTSALLPAAVYWAGRQYLPGRWAALAAVFTIIQFGLSNYWAQSYWGGNLAAIGGALLIGAARRAELRPNVLLGACIGGGLVLMAITRPFEGLVTSLVFGSLWMVRAGRTGVLRSAITPVAPAATAILVLGGAGLGYYNWRTTGDPLLMPYQVHERTYAQSSLLPGGEYNPPEYRHDVIKEYNETERSFRARNRRPTGFLVNVLVKAPAQILTFFGIISLPLLLGATRLGTMLKKRPELWPVAGATAVVITMSWFTVGFPHYLAPVLAGMYVLTASLLRYLHRSGSGDGRNRIVVWSLLLTAATALAQTARTVIPVADSSFGAQRAALEAELAALPRKDLVFVSYGPSHNLDNEWVYNRAQIDDSEVVWARDMGPLENRALIEYFPTRRVWLLKSGHEGPRPRALHPETIELVPLARS